VTLSGPVTVSGPVNVAWQEPAYVQEPAYAQAAPKPPAIDTPVGRPSAVRARVPTTTVRQAPDADGNAELELKTEDLTVQRATVSNGSVLIRKVVEAKDISIPVDLAREEYVVERIPAGGPPTTPFGDGQMEINVPLTRQTATPVITPRVIEVIRIKKTLHTDQQNVTGRVRTETVDVTKVQ